jgi:PhnB protein
MAAKVSYIPKDYNSVTPYLIIKGAAQAIDYYKKVFGATETMRMPGPEGKIGHAELKIGNSQIMLADENPSMGAGHTSAATVGGSPVSLYVYLPNVDEVVKRATTEGAKLLRPVQDQFYGPLRLHPGSFRTPLGRRHPHRRCLTQGHARAPEEDDAGSLARTSQSSQSNQEAGRSHPASPANMLLWFNPETAKDRHRHPLRPRRNLSVLCVPLFHDQARIARVPRHLGG